MKATAKEPATAPAWAAARAHVDGVAVGTMKAQMGRGVGLVGARATVLV